MQSRTSIGLNQKHLARMGKLAANEFAVARVMWFRGGSVFMVSGSTGVDSSLDDS